MKITNIIVTSLLAVGVLVSVPAISFAENQIGQLNFDVRKRTPRLERKYTSESSKFSARARLGSDEIEPASRSMQSYESRQFEAPRISPNEAIRFAPPWLRGVVADDATEHSITTGGRWQSSAGGSCFSLISRRTSCDRAKAYKELFYRFTGSDDFFEMQCHETSCRKGQRGAATSISIKDGSNAYLDVVEDNLQCNLRLSKKLGDEPWQLIIASKVECECLPEKCL